MTMARCVLCFVFFFFSVGLTWCVVTQFTDDVRAREVAFALNKIKLAVHNESPWNYLNGLLRGQDLAHGLYARLFEDCLALAVRCSLFVLPGWLLPAQLSSMLFLPLLYRSCCR